MSATGGYWGATKPPPGVPINPGHPLTRNLIAYWPLGDGAGRPQDIWGNYPLTNAGGNPTTALGHSGSSSVALHGNPEQFTSTRVTDAVAGQTRATLSAWMYRAATTDPGMVGWAPNNSFRWFILWYTDATVYWTLDAGPGGDSSPNCPLAGIGWHHFVFTFDGARSGLGRVPVYIDGVPRTLTAFGGNPGATLSTIANLGDFLIGRDNRADANFWGVGRVEDVGLWNRTLTPQEASELYTQPYAMFAPPVWRRYFIAPVQLAVPISDVSAGGWTASTGTDLYPMVDETVADDSDYILSPRAPANAEAKMRLGPLTDPSSSTGHIVRYRYYKDPDGGAQGNLTVTLYAADGTTAIASQAHTNVAPGVVAGTFTLSGAEADAIPSADYATGLVLGVKGNAP